MKYIICVFVFALACGIASCDDDGDGKISRYCAAFCEWQDECNDWFEDQWDDESECRSECRDDIADGWTSDPCRGEWLSYYTCYYEESLDDCTGIDAHEECEDQWDRLVDCDDDDEQYYGDGN